MIRTIVFDFGNVIGYFDHQRAIAELAAFTDMPPPELFAAIYGGRIEDDYERNLLTTEQFVAAALAAGRLKCTPEQFLAAFVGIFWLNDELAAFVPTLKPRYRLVLASNTNEAHFLRFREQFKATLRHFDHLVVSHDAGARKPNAAFFEYAQRFTGAERDECLFVDDLSANIAAAETFGWRGTVYRDFGRFRAELAEAGVSVL